MFSFEICTPSLFSPSPPGVQILKQNRHRIFDINISTPLLQETVMGPSYEHATREQSRRQAECLRRDLTVLIVDHLRHEGLFEAAEAVVENIGWDLDEYRVCDNVDLGLVLADFVNFYQMRWVTNQTQWLSTKDSEFVPNLSSSLCQYGSPTLI